MMISLILRKKEYKSEMNQVLQYFHALSAMVVVLLQKRDQFTHAEFPVVASEVCSFV